MKKIIVLALFIFGAVIACSNIDEHPRLQKVTVEQCFKAKMMIVDKDENFDERAEYTRDHTDYECHCIIKLGNPPDDILITYYDVHRNGSVMWDEENGSIKYIDNIYKQITGEEMPLNMCK